MASMTSPIPTAQPDQVVFGGIDACAKTSMWPRCWTVPAWCWAQQSFRLPGPVIGGCWVGWALRDCGPGWGGGPGSSSRDLSAG